MRSQRILVIEDDDGIRQGILDALEFEGYTPIACADGTTGKERATTGNFELMLLDLTLPGCDGLEILREVRKAQSSVPVIILTARGAEDDRVSGLRLGADDYVVKPFSVKELLARIGAVLRRSPERPHEVSEVTIPGGKLDFERQEVRFEGETPVALSDRELELLRYLAGNSGRAVARDEILTRVWRLDPRGVETRTIDMHVARLREKLREDPKNPQIIRTVRGKGYMWGESEVASS